MHQRPTPWSLLLWLTLLLSTSQAGARTPVIIITDLEPDDRIALLLVAAELAPDDIALVGTTALHAGRKQALVQQNLAQLGLETVPVVQGSGGAASDYPDIASSRAARTYRDEGRGLLPDAELARMPTAVPRSSIELSERIREQLREHPGTEILLLAAATDLVAAIEAEPQLAANIGHIHLMGGWSTKTADDGQMVRRTTYNWNMDPLAAARLMTMDTIPMTLYSSDLIKANFAGGSINPDNSPIVMATLDGLRDKQPAVAAFFTAAASWDHHLIEAIPALKPVIGDNAGQQFTPADPIVVVGMNRPNMVLKQRPVHISIDLADLDPARGYRVRVSDDRASRIELVETIDAWAFRRAMVCGLFSLPTDPGMTQP